MATSAELLNAVWEWHCKASQVETLRRQLLAAEEAYKTARGELEAREAAVGTHDGLGPGGLYERYVNVNGRIFRLCRSEPRARLTICQITVEE